MRVLLLCLFILLPPQAACAASFLEKAAALEAAGKMPGLARDGIVLPRALLLDELKKKAESKTIDVKDLLLSDGQGTVVLTAHGKVDAEIRVNFEFLSVDWPNRTVWVRYGEESRAIGDTWLGRIFGSIAIAVFEAASGADHVAASLEGKSYYKLEGDRLGILLDKIPSLTKPLSARAGRFKLFDLIGIRRLRTEKDGIHVTLGLV